MTAEPVPGKWQDIGWNGVRFQVPATWNPTVIYPDYLFFEQNNTPVFEIKWQDAQGAFSPDRYLKQLAKSLPEKAHIIPGELAADLHQALSAYTVSGFRIEHESGQNDALILYCPICKRITLIQWYLDSQQQSKLLEKIFCRFLDHPEKDEQTWSIYDIQVDLPVQAKLKNHEFLPGKFTLQYEIGATSMTLFRFKPAGIILANSSVEKFGQELLNSKPDVSEENLALWNYQLKGINRLLARLRRKPTLFWMKVWHIPDQNVILCVKAESSRLTDTDWLEKISSSYTAVDTC